MTLPPPCRSLLPVSYPHRTASHSPAAPALQRAPSFDIFVPPPGANEEEAMVAEAIRRSLLDSSGAPEASSGARPPSPPVARLLPYWEIARV